jgi:hypothetical protein
MRTAIRLASIVVLVAHEVGGFAQQSFNGPDQPVTIDGILRAPDRWEPPPQPDDDGWESEAVAESVTDSLNELIDVLFVSPGKTWKGVVSPGVKFSQFPKLSGGVETAERSIRTARPPNPIDDSADEGEFTHEGAQALVAAIRQWSQAFPEGAIPHGKFKVLDIDLDQNTARTLQHLSLGGFGQRAGFQLRCLAIIQWELRVEQPPRVTSIRFHDVEYVEQSHRSEPWLRDRTAAFLHDVDAFGDLQFSLEDWMDRREGHLTSQFGHHGLALGDVNGDGRDDLYVCQPGGLANLLLVQRPDGSVVDTAHRAGVDFLDLTRSALLVDFDNDGDQDLAVATANRVVILANNGEGVFSRRCLLADVRDVNSMAAADVDADGLVDIYACVYSHDGDKSRGSPTPLPIHDARNGGRNVLLHNRPRRLNSDDWRFVDATSDFGLDVNNDRWSYAAAWEDFDDDGDPDLLVANDFGRNNLYRQENGRFSDVLSESGMEQSAFGMSVSWADYDRDGRMDAYLGNMFSGAGRRVTSQSEFQAGADPAVRQSLRQAAMGNTLFRNIGGGKFRDVARTAGVDFGRWAWGSLFADINNDGWEDLLVANGFVTSSDPQDL